jgi:monofunctional biosynthetic peptidoglycan transglycosylase
VLPGARQRLRLADSRLFRWWRASSRLGRTLIAVTALMILGPVLMIAPLNIIDPPWTMVMLGRALERYREGISPTMPKRTVVPRSGISPALARAILASEDDGFYLHHGFDVQQIEKALAAKKQGRRLRGASTISQQTVKNIFLWNGRSFARKMLEAYLTVYLELLVPKDRILEIYLNLVECADGVFGVEAAARFYYLKPASEIDAEEAARIAAVLPNPRTISPFGDYANERAAQILEIMSYPIPRP